MCYKNKRLSIVGSFGNNKARSDDQLRTDLNWLPKSPVIADNEWARETAEASATRAL